MRDEWGFTNEESDLRWAIAYRGAMISDGWTSVPLYPANESVDEASRMTKDGFVAHAISRTSNPSTNRHKYLASVHCWGPDGLVIEVPNVYDWNAIKSGLRKCGYCGAQDVPTQQVGFAGRCCEKCLVKARERDEKPGWCD